MRCDDGGYYIVKFQNNPQHLADFGERNAGNKAGGEAGLPVPRTEVVEVRRELVELTGELVMQLGLGPEPCRPASSSVRAIRGIRRD
jgi:hypothetical protein